MSVRSPPRNQRVLLCAIPLGIFTVANLVGVTFMPYLLAKAPLVLVALSPVFRHLVLASPVVDAGALFAVAVPRHFAPDPFVYLIGREYGPGAVDWLEVNSPLVGKMVRGLERLFAKVGPLALLVSPDIAVSTIAGAARVSFPVFVVMNVLGTVANVAVARWAGDVLDVQIRALVAFFQSHLAAVTAASIAIIALLNWYSSQKRAGEAAARSTEAAASAGAPVPVAETKSDAE